MPVSEISLLAGLGTALCLSLAWPYCFQKQWGIGGFPCCPNLCKFDCGWIGENDHEYFGTDEDRANEEAEERRRRMVWARHIVREREQERIREAMGKIHIPIALPIPDQARQFAHGLGLGGHRAANGATSASAANGENSASAQIMRRNARDENLDELIGGSRLRQPNRGSILVHGPPGVDERPGNRRSRARGMLIPAPPVGDIEGNEDTPLNRGRMGPQTVVVSPVQQRNLQEYTSTAPMVLPEPADTRQERGSGNQ